MRRRQEHGFTLIELLIVVVVIAILITIAVPAYGGLQDRANERAAEHALHSTLIVGNVYGLDNDGYTGMTMAKLRKTYDANLTDDVTIPTKVVDYFCLKTVSANGNTYWLRGPEGIETEGTKKADRPTGC